MIIKYNPKTKHFELRIPLDLCEVLMAEAVEMRVRGPLAMIAWGAIATMIRDGHTSREDFLGQLPAGEDRDWAEDMLQRGMASMEDPS